MDRLTGRTDPTPPPAARSRPTVQDAVDASIQRKKSEVDPEKVKIFVQVMHRFRSLTDPVKTADLARIKLLMQNDPVFAAIKSQKEFLEILLDSSKGDPALMGTHVANSCFGICELVVEEEVSPAIGREYFDIYKNILRRVGGIRTPFEGGIFDFNISLELAREAVNRNNHQGDK